MSSPPEPDIAKLSSDVAKYRRITLALFALFVVAVGIGVYQWRQASQRQSQLWHYSCLQFCKETVVLQEGDSSKKLWPCERKCKDDGWKAAKFAPTR